MAKDYSDKIEELVAVAYKKALLIVEKQSPPDTSSNSLVVAASFLTPILIEIDMDEENDTKDDGPEEDDMDLEEGK